MTAFTITIPDRDTLRLEDLARELETTVEEVASEVVRERVKREEEFNAATERVTEKNAELYRRLG